MEHKKYHKPVFQGEFYNCPCCIKASSEEQNFSLSTICLFTKLRENPRLKFDAQTLPSMDKRFTRKRAQKSVNELIEAGHLIRIHHKNPQLKSFVEYEFFLCREQCRYRAYDLQKNNKLLVTYSENFLNRSYRKKDALPLKIRKVKCNFSLTNVVILDTNKANVLKNKVPDSKTSSTSKKKTMANLNLNYEEKDTGDPRCEDLTRSRRNLDDLPCTQRFNLNYYHLKSYEWLKNIGVNTDENTLCYWAKTYSHERLKEVHEEVVRYKAKKPGAYMNFLLKRGKVVLNPRIEMNKKFAESYCREKYWPQLEIYRTHCRVNGVDIEINLNKEPLEFMATLVAKHDLYQNMRE